METMKGIVDHLPEGRKLAALMGGGVLIASATSVIIKKRRQAARLQKHAETPRGTVLLHQIGRSLDAPSLSPFPIKLELYLRINKIPYENDLKDGMGPKGKTPWMTFNEEHIADSQLCIDHLNHELGIDMNKHLSPEQKAIARAMRLMMEDNMYWIVAQWRYAEDGGPNQYMRKVIPQVGPVFMWFIRRQIKKRLYDQGIGRHTIDEINQIAEQNVTALSDFLGNKKYLMGDVPCEEDCCIFGFLCQLLYCLPGCVAEGLMRGKYSNLKDYVERIKAEYWPDWEDCIGQTMSF